MMTLNRKQFAFGLYYFGLILLVAALPLSKFVMSIALFMLAAGWLIDGEYKNKFRKFFSSRLALILVSVYLMHLIGMLYTSDFNYALKDIRIKLPLLILPFLLFTSPKLSSSQFEKILLAFVSGITVSTLISLMVYLGIIKRPVVDIRDISIFISHIRLVLLCCMAAFTCVWLIYKHRNDTSRLYFMVLLPVMAWLVYFVFFIQSLTGMLILLAISGVLLTKAVFTLKHTWLKVSLILGFLVLVSGTAIFLKTVNDTFMIREVIIPDQLEMVTPSGNAYYHITERNEYENGNFIWVYICEDELEREWNSRSSYDYLGSDQRNQELRITLIRYLSSKGLRKDSTGVWHLNDKDIKAVEKGIANVIYRDMTSIRARVHQVLWEFHNAQLNSDPSGHSVTQRMEYWRAAMGIINDNLWIGVGTGDVPLAFSEQYVKMQSMLRLEWRLRAHNQFLSIGVAFGLAGLAWFVFSLFYPVYISFRRSDLLYLAFSLIAVISMLTEDTLETQAGVTFFALFTSLFLFVNPENHAVGGKKGVL